MKEVNFQKILVTAFRQAGAIVFNIHGHAMQIAGIPDLYVAHKIWTGWLELKTGENATTKLQTRTLGSLEAAGVNVFILLERKPKIIVKNSCKSIVANLPFMTCTPSGIELLGRLKSITELLKDEA